MASVCDFISATGFYTRYDVKVVPSISDLDNGSSGGCATSLGQTFTRAWSVVSRPPLSNAAVTVDGAGDVHLTPDRGGTYLLQLLATDSNGLTAVSTFPLTASTIPAGT